MKTFRTFEENDGLIEALMEGNGCLDREIIVEDYGEPNWELLEKDERVVVSDSSVALDDEYVLETFGLVYVPERSEYVEAKK